MPGVTTRTCRDCGGRVKKPDSTRCHECYRRSVRTRRACPDCGRPLAPRTLLCGDCRAARRAAGGPLTRSSPGALPPPTCSVCGGPVTARHNVTCHRCRYPAELADRRPRVPPPEPTGHRPGSEGKVAVLAWRREQGFGLYHPRDARE